MISRCVRVFRICLFIGAMSVKGVHHVDKEPARTQHNQCAIRGLRALKNIHGSHTHGTAGGNHSLKKSIDVVGYTEVIVQFRHRVVGRVNKQHRGKSLANSLHPYKIYTPAF
jgi:hypothetical protein